MICIIAFFVFAVMSVFSAQHRPLAKEAFTCVFHKMTLRPCQSGLDNKIKMKVVSRVFNRSPFAAKAINTHFELFSWAFIFLTVASFIVVAEGAYNLYTYGTCDPVHPELCLFTDAVGGQPICPNSYEGISIGPPDARVLLIEFGCFTCPYTQSAEADIQSILAKYPDGVRYVFKAFPIPAHGNSFESAAASVCANSQGKYWEYRKEMFDDQAAIISGGSAYLVSLAGKLGMNASEFESCMGSNATLADVRMMEEEGISSRIKGTPAFFVNHRYVADPAKLEEIVQQELAK